MNIGERSHQNVKSTPYLPYQGFKSSLYSSLVSRPGEARGCFNLFISRARESLGWIGLGVTVTYVDMTVLKAALLLCPNHTGIWS